MKSEASSSSYIFILRSAVLKLHHVYYARVMLDRDTRPLDSPYFLSFLRTYRSACMILRCVWHASHGNESRMDRLPPLWGFVLVCAVSCRLFQICGGELMAAEGGRWRCCLRWRCTRLHARSALGVRSCHYCVREGSEPYCPIWIGRHISR